MKPFRFDIITLFPNLIEGYLTDSIIKRAQEANQIEIKLWQLRDFSDDQKHHKVDDTPYGGGAGMVIRPQPLWDAIEAVKKVNSGPVIYLTPQGEKFNQKTAENFASEERELILLCGRYEGIDQRIRESLIDLEVSIGDYVLTGGELPALILVDAISRLIPGVLGDEESHQQDSFAKAYAGKKEYPHYTRPAEFKGMPVPEVLLSGNHAEIEKWRQQNLKD